MQVNWCELAISHASLSHASLATGATGYHETTAELLFRNSFATNLSVTAATSHASLSHASLATGATGFALTLPAYSQVRQALGRRDTFFHDIRALTRYQLFASWEELLAFMVEGLELTPDTS